MSSAPSPRRDAWRRLAAATPPPWVLRHSLAVESLAAAMAERAEAQGLAVNHDLVRSGALLHDVGRSITQDVRHAFIGADLLRKDGGWPEPLVAVVERHTGAGIPADEAARLGLPARDYVPTTLEERIVAHADNLYSGDRRIGLAELRAKYEAKGLKEAWRRIDALHTSLCDLLAVDLEKLPPQTLPDPGP